MSYKRNYSTAFGTSTYSRPRNGPYTSSVPMSMVQATNSRGSTGRYPRRRSNYRRSGPYSALTANNYHVNPLYPRAELKYIDNTQGGAAPGAAPTTDNLVAVGLTTYLCRVPQGTGASERVGLQINVKSVTYRFEVNLSTGTAPTSGRVVLIWDKQPLATGTPSYATIFANPNYLAFMNPANTQRFTILRNTQFSLSPNGDQELFFEGYCRLNMLSTYLTGQTTPVTGCLLLALVSDGGGGGTPVPPVISGIYRMRYSDS